VTGCPAECQRRSELALAQFVRLVGEQDAPAEQAGLPKLLPSHQLNGRGDAGMAGNLFSILGGPLTPET
jgi:hypothetical protein